MKRPVNIFSISKNASFIFSAVPKHRFIYSLMLFVLTCFMNLALYFSVRFYFLDPWKNFVLLSQILAIVFSCISSLVLIYATIYQVIVCFSNFKSFSERVGYAALTLVSCLISFLATGFGVYFTLCLL